jgi:hypothetical protein
MREHIGEPVGPDGMHVPFPVMRPIPLVWCVECELPAAFRLEGFLADGAWTEVPLCEKHSIQANQMLFTRKETLRKRDENRRSSR